LKLHEPDPARQKFLWVHRLDWRTGRPVGHIIPLAGYSP